ncbi:unnamed protein product [Acanthoscelides obtectus]|nr:unnamed protein product [Acanthoscelides obtectus]CAK1662051.1 TRAF-type zinc finger domain-containing protein 1 [Acanthoscelides obtectus]
MHMVHCSKNIKLCKICQEPQSKQNFEKHEEVCKKQKYTPQPLPAPPPTDIERSPYFRHQKIVEDRKAEARKDRYMKEMTRFVDSGHSLGSSHSTKSAQNGYSQSSSQNGYSLSSRQSSVSSSQSGIGTQNDRDSYEKYQEIPREQNVEVKKETGAVSKPKVDPPKSTPSSGMLACKFCDLELPKLELEEHENYCGTRTDRCLECGQLVMFKDKQAHIDSNHGLSARRNRDSSVRTSWDSTSARIAPTIDVPDYTPPRRRSPLLDSLNPLANFDYDPMPYLPSAYQTRGGAPKKKDGESYKEISRRLDCKTEYIRNLLHDSACITAPLRRNGLSPRNHFYHDTGLSVGSGSHSGNVSPRRNPPTEIIIPCEICEAEIPHKDLAEHMSVCRIDFSRYRRRQRTPDFDERAAEQQAERDAEEELPCEFCGDMIPASRLLGHQIRCS